MPGPSDSCTVSVADDGDVAFIIGTKDYRPGQSCTVVLQGRALLIQQGGWSIVEVEELGEQDVRAISNAASLRVFNVLEPGRADEAIHVNKDVMLIAR